MTREEAIETLKKIEAEKNATLENMRAGSKRLAGELEASCSKVTPADLASMREAMRRVVATIDHPVLEVTPAMRADILSPIVAAAEAAERLRDSLTEHVKLLRELYDPGN